MPSFLLADICCLTKNRLLICFQGYFVNFWVKNSFKPVFPLWKCSKTCAWDLNTWEHLCVEVGGKEVSVYLKTPKWHSHLFLLGTKATAVSQPPPLVLASLDACCAAAAPSPCPSRASSSAAWRILLSLGPSTAPPAAQGCSWGPTPVFIQLSPTLRAAGRRVSAAACYCFGSSVISGTLVKNGVLSGLEAFITLLHCGLPHLSSC